MPLDCTETRLAAERARVAEHPALAVHLRRASSKNVSAMYLRAQRVAGEQARLGVVARLGSEVDRHGGQAYGFARGIGRGNRGETFEPSLTQILAFCAEDPVERVFLEDVARRGLGRFAGARRRRAADGALPRRGERRPVRRRAAAAFARRGRRAAARGW